MASAPASASVPPSAPPATSDGAAEDDADDVPFWKQRSGDVLLVSLCLKAVAKATRAAFEGDKWQAAEALMARLGPGKLPLIELQSALIARTIRGGSFDDACFPLGFFSDRFRSLSFNGAGRITCKWLTQALERCPNLTALDVGSCYNFSDDALRATTQSCTGLQQLVLEGCRRLSPKAVQLLVGHTPNLHSIDVGGCYNFTLLDVEKLILTHPNASSWRSVHVSGLPFSLKVLHHLGAHGGNLRSLGVGFSTIAMAGLQPVVQGSPGLRHLRLHWCSAIDDACLLEVSTRCPHLTELDLTGSSHLTSAGIVGFVASHAVHRAHPVDAESAARRCLRKLHVKFTALTPEHAAHIADMYPTVELIQ